MATSIIILVASTLLILVCFLIATIKISQYKKRQSYIINFESYITILNYHLEKAFDIIYKDRVLIYSLEATKMDDDQFEVTTKDFIKLVLKMVGPTIVEELTFLYGDEETFLFNITEYFNTRFEDDEIRKTSMTSLMESDVEDQMTNVMETK